MLESPFQDYESNLSFLRFGRIVRAFRMLRLLKMSKLDFGPWVRDATGASNEPKRVGVAPRLVGNVKLKLVNGWQEKPAKMGMQLLH